MAGAATGSSGGGPSSPVPRLQMPGSPSPAKASSTMSKPPPASASKVQTAAATAAPSGAASMLANRRPRNRPETDEEMDEATMWYRGALDEARRSGDFNLNVGNSSVLTDELYRIHHLFSVRLIGVNLQEVPLRIGQDLRVLRTLSFRSNALTELPDNLGQLHYLTELSAMDNRIQRFPSNMNELSSLQVLDMSYNHLREFPDCLGTMTTMRKLSLQNNFMSALPDGTRNLTNMTYLNISANNFAEYPQAISWAVSLRTLLMNKNRMTVLPRSIGKLVNLKELQVANNALIGLPSTLGQLTALEELRVDWNQISIVPRTFAMLTNLCVFTAEGNPLTEPTMAVVVRGAAAVRTWCEFSSEGSLFRRRQHIVRDLQAVCADAMRYHLVDLGYLTADIVRPGPKGEPLKYYGVVYAALMSRIVPRVNEFRQRNGEGKLFLYDVQDVKDAVENFSDPLGPAGLADQPVLLKRCRCVGPDGQRRVCIPPRVGYVCSRLGLLLRMSLETQESIRRRNSLDQEVRAVHRAREAAKQKLLDYFSTPVGDEWLTKSAETAVRVIREALAAGVARHKRLMEKARKLEEPEKKRQMFIARKETRIRKLVAKRQAYKKRLAEEDDPIKRLPLEDKVKELAVQIKHGMRENQQIVIWHQKGVELMEALAIDEENYDEAEELAFASVNAPNPVLRSFLNETTPRGFLAGLGRDIDALVDFMVATKSGERDVPGFRKMFAEEMIKSAMREAEDEIHKNYALIRRIGDQWQAASVKRCFLAWFGWAREQRTQRLKGQELAEFHAAIHAETQWADHVLLEAERAKWVEKTDPFTDKPYFEHVETGEVAWTIPERRFKHAATVL